MDSLCEIDFKRIFYEPTQSNQDKEIVKKRIANAEAYCLNAKKNKEIQKDRKEKQNENKGDPGFGDRDSIPPTLPPRFKFGNKKPFDDKKNEKLNNKNDDDNDADDEDDTDKYKGGQKGKQNNQNNQNNQHNKKGNNNNNGGNNNGGKKGGKGRNDANNGNNNNNKKEQGIF